MKYFRRFFLLVLSASLFLNTVCVFAKSEQDYSETDVFRIQKLQSLGLWASDMNEEAVTRGDFARLMVALMGLEQSQLEGMTWNTVFDDVTTEHLAYRAVSFLADRGVVASGDVFEPDRPITYYEAVKMLVCVLGYEAAAVDNGGFPFGYLITANQFGIVRRVKSGDTETLSAVFCAEMLEHAMDVKPMEPEYKYPDGGWKIKNTTALQEYHKINTYTGVLKVLGDFTLEPGTKRAADTIVIDKEQFCGDVAKYEEYLGYQVTAYFKTDEDGADREIIYLEPVFGKNQILEITEDKILGFENNDILYESESGKISRVSVNFEKMRILLNDVPAIPAEEEIRTADRIVLIDNGGGYYALMKVENWNIYVADNLDHTDNTLTDRFWKNEKRVVSLGEKNGVQIVDIKNHLGIPTDFYAVKKNSVLRVKRSRDEERISIILTNVKKEGILKEISTDGKKLKLDDENYSVAPKSVALEQMKGAEPGEKYALYLDDQFRVAGMERLSSSEEQYGYLMNVASADAFQSTARFRILTLDNRFEELISADRIQVDGEMLKSGTDIIAALLNEQGRVERQPVRYRLNEAGKLVYLDTAKLGGKEYSNGTFRGNHTMTKYDSFIGGRFIGDPPMFGAEAYNSNDNTQYNVKMTAKTPVFCVPPLNATEEQLRDDKNYYVGNIRIFKNYSTYKENATTGERVDAYDLNENWTAGLLVYYTRKTTAEPITDKTPITVVQGITRGLDAEGNPQSYLKGFQAGNYISVPIQEGFENLKKEYYTADGTVASTVRFGDVIRFSLDSLGKIDDYEKVFSLKDEDNPEYVRWGNEVNSANTAQNNPSLISWSEGYTENGYCTPFVYKTKEAFEAEYRVVFGTLKERVGNNIVLAVGGEKPMTIVGDIQRYNVLVVDEERQDMYMPDLNEFQPESAVGAENAAQILMHTSKGSSRTVVLVKRAKR